MNKGFIFTTAFAFGAAAGSVVTWKLLKTKYEQLARAEIEEIRDYYANSNPSIDNTEEQTEEEPSEPSTEESNERKKTFMEYSSIASTYSGDKTDEGGDESVSRQEPYVISPAEFGEIESYETATIIYYNDGVLADSDNNRIDDIESCIGYESLNHFGEYGDDSVYVRNDDAMTDYEVLLDDSNFADIEEV